MSKQIPIPKGYDGIHVGENKQVVSNPYSGKSCELTPLAVAVYDTIKGAELFGKYGMMQNGLDWFIKYYPKEYITLLD